MLTEITRDLLQLSNQIKAYEALYTKEKVDTVELLHMQGEIEEKITAFSILLQKLPKVKITFEAVRDYYIKEVLHKNTDPQERNP